VSNNAFANNALNQDITPAVSTWLAEQRAAGFGQDQLLKSLIDAGWGDAAARHLLAMPASVGADDLPAPLPVPWPAHAGERLVLEAGDRQVNATTVLQDPPLLVLEGLLSREECQALMAVAAPRMSRSLTVDVKTGGEETNQARTSEGMFFERGESELISRIESRIGALLGWPVHNGEGLQVLRYGPGAEYKPHYDYFDPAEPGTASILQRGGQRVATLVMYLNEPEAGGATVFPDAALAVVPKCGNAVFFSYSQPHPVSRTLHGGAPVVSGEKWIATKWLREREFI
jgi:prolyl 4-hydroxylase